MRNMLGALRLQIAPGLAALALGIAFVYGVFFSGFDKYYFAPALILVAFIAALALASSYKKGWAFPTAPVAMFLLGFWVWMALSLLWSHVPNISMIFCVTIGSLPLLFFTLTQSDRSADLLKACRAVLIIAVTVLALWADFQFAFLSDIVGDRVHHPMLNANNLGVVVSIGIFLVMPLFAQGSGIARWFYGLLIALYILAIMAAQSRGSMLGFLAGAGLFAVASPMLMRQRWRSFATLTGVLLAEVAVFFMIMKERYNIVSHLAGGGDAAASNQNRLYLWKAGLKMLADHPVYGPGLGTFYLTYPRYRPFGDTSDGFFLHMDPLQFGVEMGFPAMVFFYGFAIAVLVRTIRAIRVKDAPNAARTEMLCGFGGLLVLMINCHLDFDLYMLPSLLLAAILLCLWYRATETILGPCRRVLTLRKPTHAIFLAPVLSLVFVLAPVWIARAGYAVQQDGIAVAAMQGGDFESAAAHAARALKYGPQNYDRAYLVDTLWRGQILQQNFVSFEAEQREKILAQAMASLDKVLLYNPYNIQALNYKALLSFMAYPRIDTDGVDKARAYLEQAMAMDPVNFDIRIGLAKISESQGRTADTISVLQDGLRYDIAKMYVPGAYRLMLAQAKIKSGLNPEDDEQQQAVQDRDKAMQEMRMKKAGVDLWIRKNIGALLDR